MIELRLDAQEMEQPEPYERAMAILSRMKQGEYLHMLHRRIPFPLLDFARDVPLSFVVSAGVDVAFEIFLFFPGDYPNLRDAGLLPALSVMDFLP